jgi:hypothetical protein
MMANIVKPTTEEQKIIDARLKKKYPQMYTKNWAQRLKGKVQKEFKTVRTKYVEKGLDKAGLTKEEIIKLRKKRKNPNWRAKYESGMTKKEMESLGLNSNVER